jgi:glycosyltransferase involved in cell wall biosynthesis
MKICFWGNIAGSVKGNTPGGGELQAGLLAKALAKSGNEVVILDYLAGEEFETSDGVKIIPIKGWDKGVRVLRTLTHRLPDLFFSLKEQKSDIYYCRIRESRHIFAYWAAKRVHAKFVLGIADGLDGMSFIQRCKNEYLTNIGGLWWFSNMILTEIFYPILIRNADAVLTQHECQKKVLMNLNKNSILFPNLINPDEIPVVTDPVREDFIYAGHLAKNKGIIELYEIIRKTPAYKYKIIGDPCDKTGLLYSDKLKSLKNATLLGRLNHHDTLYQLANAKALINTSPFEGFPNVFLEAWSCGIPVFSLYVNPGNILSREGIGRTADGDIDKLIEMMSETDNSRELSTRAKEYVNKNHVLNENKIREIDNIFKNLPYN